jgi:hypothetical protein
MFFIYHRMRNITRAAVVVLSVFLTGTGTYAAVIPVGPNYFESIPGLTTSSLDFSRDNIDRNFFGPGSDIFMGFIRLKGRTINPILGTTNVIMQRREEINLVLGARPVRADLSLITLELQSVTPITVTYNSGQNPEQWDVRVSRQESAPEEGRIVIDQRTADGGTYDATVTTRIFVKFTRRSDGAIRQLPFGLIMGTGPVNVPWSFSANPPLFTDGHFCPSCVAGDSRDVLFSGPILTLKLRPATTLRGP